MSTSVPLRDDTSEYEFLEKMGEGSYGSVWKARIIETSAIGKEKLLLWAVMTSLFIVLAVGTALEDKMGACSVVLTTVG